jgi:uncharacterized protein YjiS (DUF1127 family)
LRSCRSWSACHVHSQSRSRSAKGFGAAGFERHYRAAAITEFLRTAFGRFAAWCRRRRERDALYAYLASDHRAASDIGYPHRLR